MCRPMQTAGGRGLHPCSRKACTKPSRHHCRSPACQGALSSPKPTLTSSSISPSAPSAHPHQPKWRRPTPLTNLCLIPVIGGESEGADRMVKAHPHNDTRNPSCKTNGGKSHILQPLKIRTICSRQGTNMIVGERTRPFDWENR
jgi:hypothetical protein